MRTTPVKNIHSVLDKPRNLRATQIGEAVVVRMQPDLKGKVDDWRRNQDDLPGRPEAVRRLIEIGLKAKK